MKWVLETGTGVYEDDGTPEFLEGFISDITNQKRLEAKLKLQTAKLEGLLDVAPEGIAVLDESQNVTRINPEFCRLFGYAPEEVLGRFLYDLIIPEDQKQGGPGCIQKLYSGKQVLEETFLKRKDGSPVAVSILATPIREQGRTTGAFVIYRDISARRKAEHKMAETCRELEVIFENSGVGVAVFKGRQTLSKCNQRLAGILGYDSPEVMVGLAMRDLHLSEDQFREFSEKFYNRLSEGPQTHIEYRLKKKDGTPVWCVLSGMTLDYGRPPDLSKGVIWVLDDITRIKLAGEELRRSEARYRFLISNSPVGIINFDTTGRILEVNDKCLEILGSPEKEETKSINVLTFPLMVQQGISRDIATCLKSGLNIVGERPYTSKWGVSRHLRFHLAPLKDERGKIEGGQFIMEDFTNHKRAEEALQASEAEMRAIFSNAAVGIIVTTPDGRYLRVNEAWAEMTGYPEGEILGKTILDLTHPDDKAASEQLMAKLKSEEIKSYRFEKRFIRKDGSTLWVETAVSPILDARGRVEEIISVNVDITERKQVEEERIKRGKLESAIETAGAVCHELNQPLQTLLGRVELLLMGTTEERELAHLKFIEVEVARMIRITRKLQRITRYETHEYLDDSIILDIDKSID